MKERGMIFNAEMVEVLRNGNKTQTRRTVSGFDIYRVSDRKEFVSRSPHNLSEKDSGGVAYAELTDGRFVGIPSPFGRPGDRIWVRETHHVNHHGSVIYKADWQGMNPFDEDDCGEDCSMVGEKWKPSIHMPRWASRITLEITDVRVERLQDISEEDAIAEGVENLSGSLWRNYQNNIIPHEFFAKDSYQTLWQSIYGNWNENPWVWAIEFKVLK